MLLGPILRQMLWLRLGPILRQMLWLRCGILCELGELWIEIK